MKNKGGRPKFLITKEVMDKAESLAARGLTLEQTASCLGISYQTLNERKKEYVEFSDAIKKGQHKGISIIANALFESAKKGNTAAQIFYMKARADWKDHGIEINHNKEESQRKVRNAEKQYK
jgi:hypothetical protein